MNLKVKSFYFLNREVTVTWFLNIDVFKPALRAGEVKKLAETMLTLEGKPSYGIIACIRAVRQIRPHWDLRQAKEWVDQHKKELRL